MHEMIYLLAVFLFGIIWGNGMGMKSSQKTINKLKKDYKALERNHKKALDSILVWRAHAQKLADRLNRQTGTTPPPNTSSSGWRKVLGFSDGYRPSKKDIDRAYRLAAKKYHPDMGGTARDMGIVNSAKKAAYEELRL